MVVQWAEGGIELDDQQEPVWYPLQNLSQPWFWQESISGLRPESIRLGGKYYIGDVLYVDPTVIGMWLSPFAYFTLTQAS